ncbi:MAG: MFS transporter [Clostridiales bacterium]|nr:MFS transporter [Clostridiales bacterium]
MIKFTYKTTITACFLGYIAQAIVNNFIPLLFITLQDTYQIPLSQITLLVTINFAIQLIVDMLSSLFMDRIGYRMSGVIAHICAAAGLILLTILPGMMDPFAGIVIAIMVYAIGGGIIEVLVSPVMESCPTDNKEKAMSLLHSFYCWGHVGVVLISTLFFKLAGIENWRVLAWIWAMIPLVNAWIFAKTPIAPLISDGEKGMSLPQLFTSKTFWILMLMMLCSGASEQAVGQWSSAFAERGLGLTKAFGDLVGPMTFAIMMGLSRVFYGKYGEQIDLERFMTLSSALCIGAYLLISLAPSPALSVVGCALCGLTVGIMWPGTFSRAAVALRNGGTAMFAMLALAGDLGCSSGPTLVGFVSGLAGENMKMGILAALVFPLVMFVCLRKSRIKADS